MAKQSVNNETQANNVAEVSVKEVVVALQLQHNYGANVVFGEYVFEPNKEVILPESEVKKLETNSNFLHYISKDIIKKYIPMQK